MIVALHFLSIVQYTYSANISHFSDEETKIYRGKINSQRLNSNSTYVCVYMHVPLGILLQPKADFSTHLLDSRAQINFFLRKNLQIPWKATHTVA
jgi:hypothetical protein